MDKTEVKGLSKSAQGTRGNECSRSKVVPPPEWLRLGSQAEQRIQRKVSGSDVLFVCTGNICRSAFAAAYLNHLLKGCGVVIESAGTHALVASPMDKRALEIAACLGIEDAVHSARQVTGRMLMAARLVLVFDAGHYKWIALNYPEHIKKTVPVGQLVQGLTKHRNRVSLSVDDIARDIKSVIPALEDSIWIEDPYRKEPEKYTWIMGTITEAVRLLANTLEW